MKGNKEFKISYWSSHLTAIVSVSLVLIIVGLILLLTVAASRETNRLQERIELSAIMADSIPDARAQEILSELTKLPAVKSGRLITSREALEEWNRQTGENLEEVFNVNPFSPEISLVLKSQYAVPDSIKKFVPIVDSYPEVEEVAVPDDRMVEGIYESMKRLFWILGPIALVMLVISFVLINNTVRLSIYSRRFTIYTMQLVGATNGFIRRPFVRRNLATGLLSGAVASAILAGGLVATEQSGVMTVAALIGWETFAVIAAILVVIGGAICSLASVLATSRYLRADYEELFKL